MIQLLGMPITELQTYLKKDGFPAFRAKQIMDYIYKRHVFSFSYMLQLPKAMRDYLERFYSIDMPVIINEKRTANEDTIKLLVKLSDGQAVETVLMKQPYGNAVCVSSQVGCAMGCVFCASTQEGLLRNLQAHEMIGQVLLFSALLQERIHSIVVMGSGEPLHNYEEVVKSLRFFHAEETFNIGFRRMTLSTCGIVDGIYRLAKENIPITLALSLHAPTDEVRRKIMPISKRYELTDVLKAVNDYYEITKRRITFEYILIKGINDSPEQARELADLLRGCSQCNVNLIPVNGTEHINLFKPPSGTIKRFIGVLEKANLTVVVRKEMGSSIQAACGQLRATHAKQKESGYEN